MFVELATYHGMFSMTISYECSDTPKTSDDDVIRHGVRAFNQSILKETQQHFSLLAKRAEVIIAGSLIWQHSDALYIDSLWCDTAYRRQGIGSQLMAMLFSIAIDKAIKQIFVDTYDFQAQDFYHKHGFVSIGVIPGYLLGHDRIFLRKAL